MFVLIDKDEVQDSPDHMGNHKRYGTMKNSQKGIISSKNRMDYVEPMYRKSLKPGKQQDIDHAVYENDKSMFILLQKF